MLPDLVVRVRLNDGTTRSYPVVYISPPCFGPEGEGQNEPELYVIFAGRLMSEHDVRRTPGVAHAKALAGDDDYLQWAAIPVTQPDGSTIHVVGIAGQPS
jgi:hypothetical protein